ncbi:MAG: hypothetical protein JSV99_08630, partial [Planctomycetota bacterium]
DRSDTPLNTQFSRENKNVTRKEIYHSHRNINHPLGAIFSTVIVKSVYVIADTEPAGEVIQ